MRVVKLFTILVLVLAATTAVAAQLEVSIAPVLDKAVLTPAEGANLRFTITNTSGEEISFVRYNTPIGGFEADLFAISRDGKHVPYIGKLAMRIGPTADDWVNLAPGESLEAIVDLSEGYDMRAGGNYIIRFRHQIGFRTSADDRDRVAARGEQQDHAVEDVASNLIETLVEGPADVPEMIAPDLPEYVYSGCTSSQQTSISTARTYGRNLSAKAYNQLNGTAGSSNALYKTWFGTYTSTRYSTVKTGFYNIYYAFGRDWTHTCTSCSSGVVAYVYPSRPYQVWICTYFHSFSSTQKGSFLLHEASHWTVVRGTQDYTYGSTNCLNLAKSSPSQAVYNADSYRYFSLNAP